MTTRTIVMAFLLGGTTLSSPLVAQSINEAVPPERLNLDANYVDRANGGINFPEPSLTIGPAGRGGLSVHGTLAAFGNQTDNGGTIGGVGTNWGLALYVNGSTYQAGLGETVETFTRSGNLFTSNDGHGSTLTLSGSTYTYTSSSGMKIIYDIHSQSSTESNIGARASKIVYPTGEQITLYWTVASYCINGCDKKGEETRVRLQSVTHSNGYHLHYVYASDTVDTPTEPTDFNNLKSILAINLAYDYCDPAAGTCATPNQIPAKIQFNQSSYTGIISLQLTDALGRIYQYAGNSTTLTVQQPSSSNPDITYALSNYIVTAATRDGITYNYAQSTGNGARTVVVTDPLGFKTSTIADTSLAALKSSTDGDGRITNYTLDTYGRVTQATAPEGNAIQYTYDSNGNVTTTIVVAKAGSGLSNIVTSAAYPCSSAATCDKPSSVTDAKGNVTNYGYDSTTGNVTSVTRPTVSVNGNSAQPQFRYTYSTYQAYFRNSSNSIVSSGVPESRLIMASTCRTTSSCTNTADESRTTYNWGNQTAGIGNNLLLISETRAAGDGSLSSTTGYSYNSAGDRNSIVDPLGNTTNIAFDLDHEITMAVTPDPDGSGPLNRRVTLFSYTPLGEVNGVAQGYAGPNGFVYLQNVNATYDAAGRILTKKLLSADSNTTYSLTQYSYDGDGRLDCTAVRMNPSAFASTSDACALSPQGSYGPDRIGRNEYDGAGHITKVWWGYRSSIPSATVFTYTPNGKLQTLVDPNSNTTTYSYDGFDRSLKTAYADASYDQLSYDSNSDPTSQRRRDGTTLSFSYDTLNRLTSVTNTASDPNESYGYDLVGHRTAAGDSNGHLLATGYDSLGRRISEADVFGPTRTFQYDAAGRRTQMRWADAGSPIITNQYDATNEITGIVENGTTQLATFAYDDLGRRTAKTFGNGTSTSYGYDGGSRVTSIAMTGTYFPDTITLGNYSPANEIGSKSQSNDYFSYNQAANVNAGYTSNNLNQYTAIAGVGQTYDGRGNLKTSGSTAYTYNSYSQLTNVTGGGSGYYYDPDGRIDTISPESLWLSYDSDRLTTEINYSGHTVARRYVFDPGTDEPLIWYEGSGTSDRRYLDADERSSIVRVTDASGTIKYINSYNEYGIPPRVNGVSNTGRFQYTGQIWLPSLGMYDYKARMYSPTLGRFMQTDPIGYGDGVNWYNYVGSDPINGIDPTGTDDTELNDHPGGGYGGDGGGGDGGGGDGGGGANGVSPIIVNAPLQPASGPSSDTLGSAPGNYTMGDGGTGVSSQQNTQGQEIVVQARYLRRAVITALNNACGCSVDPSNFLPLSPNFVQVIDQNKLPKIFKGSLSAHAKASSTAIPNSNFVLKFYSGDTDNGGLSTLTITTPLTDPEHYIDFLFSYSFGDPINSYYARQYCLNSGNCG